MSTPTPRTDAAVTLTFAAGHNTVCPNVARTLERELAAALIENQEQARLLGMSAERECDLRGKVERLTKQIKDDNRSYGCELRDPYGTIWEQATKDHDRAEKAEAELAALREDRERLDWLEKNGPDILISCSCWKCECAVSNPWTIHRDFAEDVIAGEGSTFRAAIDAAMKGTNQ